MGAEAGTKINLRNDPAGGTDGTLTESALHASIQMESALAETQFTAPLSTIFDNRLLLDAQQELRKDRPLK